MVVVVVVVLLLLLLLLLLGLVMVVEIVVWFGVFFFPTRIALISSRSRHDMVKTERGGVLVMGVPAPMPVLRGRRALAPLAPIVVDIIPPSPPPPTPPPAERIARVNMDRILVLLSRGSTPACFKCRAPRLEEWASNIGTRPL